MKAGDRDAFLAPRQARWDELERLLKRGPSTASDWSSLASGYRSLCSDLSRARGMGLPADVVGYLDELAGRAHNALYSTRSGRSFGIGRTIFSEFPAELRRQWRFTLLSLALFYGPFFLCFAVAVIDPSSATYVLPESSLEEMEAMYSDSVSRSIGEDFTMAGFYIFNNVGIGFRTFATGALGGLGSLFFLVYNGVVLGTTIGYLTGVGLGRNLYDFVIGHSAWELNGIVFAGTAGLKLGWAMLVPGTRTRIDSVRAEGPVVYRIIAGAAFMIFVAAFIEGFWSSSPIPFPIKVAFALAQFAIVGAWLMLGGRGTSLESGERQ